MTRKARNGPPEPAKRKNRAKAAARRARLRAEVEAAKPKYRDGDTAPVVITGLRTVLAKVSGIVGHTGTAIETLHQSIKFGETIRDKAECDDETRLRAAELALKAAGKVIDTALNYHDRMVDEAARTGQVTSSPSKDDGDNKTAAVTVIIK